MTNDTKCNICGIEYSVSGSQKFIENGGGSTTCKNCFFKARACNVCGKTAKYLDQFADTYSELKGKYYCADCYKGELERALGKIIFTSTNNIEGERILDYIGFESVEIVIGTGIISEIDGEIKDFFGYRSSEFEKKLQMAKSTAILLIKKKALDQDANAIIGADLDYTEFTRNRIAVVVNGTLVKIEKI